MIKRAILLTGITICAAMLFGGCAGDDEKTATTTTVATDKEEIKETTTSEVTTAETTTENVTENVTEESTTQQEDIYEEVDGYKIKPISIRMKTTARMNIRKGPRETYDRIGGLNTNQEIKAIGYCELTDWYKIEHEGLVGYVSGEYLVEIEEETYKLVLGDECPYVMLVKATYNGQEGWFYSASGEDRPKDYEALIKEIMEEDGYTIENDPIYIGTWRDVGDVMWMGYSKKQ